jgi:excinuclease ABC subunit C
MRDRDSDLLRIPGVGAQTRLRLIGQFGSLSGVKSATLESLMSVVPRKTAEAIRAFFDGTPAQEPPLDGTPTISRP